MENDLAFSGLNVEFTKEGLSGLQPAAKRYEVADPDNRYLVLAVHPSGRKVFYVRRKVGRRTERVKVGEGCFPELGVKEARRLALAILGEIASGRNPAAAKREQKRRRKTEVPLQEAWDAYRRHREHGADERRMRSVDHDRWRWAAHLEKSFGNRPLTEITRPEVARWHADLTRGSGPTAANRARALLSSIYGHWSRVTGIDLANPCRGVAKNREGRRERYLTAGELRSWWSAVLAEGNRDRRELLALLTLVPVRSGTLRTWDWSEIDWLARSWRIPAEKLKSGRPWVQPLPSPAMGVLVARWERSGRPTSGPVLASREGHCRRELRDAFDPVAKAAGLCDFTPHDTRRTAATAASEAGVDSAVIAFLLQHVGASVLDIYRRVTPTAAATAAEKMAVALLKPAGLEPGDFARGLPAVGAMRPEVESDNLLAFTVAHGDGPRD